MMSPWNRSWKWNPAWNVRQVPWSLKSKTLLPHQDLCSWLIGVCIASLLGLLNGSACSFLSYIYHRINQEVNCHHCLYPSCHRAVVTPPSQHLRIWLWLHLMMVVSSTRRWDKWLFVCRSTWILQLVLLSLILEGQLCSVHALVGGAGEDIVSTSQTMFIQSSRSCLLCRGHGCKNGLAPFRH